jgi:hypothetical protein
MPNRLVAIGISSSEPPATPDAPQAASEDTRTAAARWEVDRDPQRVRRGQRHHRDRDRRARHVDRGAERDRDRVGVLVQAQARHSSRLIGMLAAELRVKKAVTPLSRRQVNTSG